MIAEGSENVFVYNNTLYKLMKPSVQQDNLLHTFKTSHPLDV